MLYRYTVVVPHATVRGGSTFGPGGTAPPPNILVPTAKIRRPILKI